VGEDDTKIMRVEETIKVFQEAGDVNDWGLKLKTILPISIPLSTHSKFSKPLSSDSNLDEKSVARSCFRSHRFDIPLRTRLFLASWLTVF